MKHTYRIGADENGLGARLGPLVVTAVLARVDELGMKALARKLPKRIRKDLNDSKELVSHKDVSLGEAWARAVCGTGIYSPNALFEKLSLEGSEWLQAPCPSHVVQQCWANRDETFQASPETVARVSAHLAYLASRGVEVLEARSSVVCTKRLNDARGDGKNRFVSDLHAMEQLVMALRKSAAAEVHAVCGKVGGMAEYGKFFGPLSGILHTVLDQGRARSAYRFAGLGELHFVRDADGTDPLVMLASLIGKYVRELLMSRVARYYVGSPQSSDHPSGYYDPQTTRFIRTTALLRKQRRIPDGCFERARDAILKPGTQQMRSANPPRAISR